MKTKHTPGPWEWVAGIVNEPIDIATYESPGYYDNPELYGKDRQPVIACGEYDVICGRTDEERVANARLLAAAPKLYEALKGLVALADSVTQGQERELRAEWLPKAREVLDSLRG